MYKSIKVALEYLPEEFVTQEMVNEAVKCKDVEVLSYIPQRMLTADIIERILNNSRHSWHGFSLKHIPEELRTELVCSHAVDKNYRNIHSVPSHIITREMAQKVMKNCSGDFDVLTTIPANIWDAELAIDAMIAQTGDYRYIEYNSAIMRLEIILKLLPQSVKTKSLYIQMLQCSSLNVSCTIKVTPAKFQDKQFYQYVAKRDLSMVPKKYISYEMLYAALFSEYTNNQVCSEYMFKEYIHLLDDRLADQLIRKHAYLYRRLPDEFRTSSVLFLHSKAARMMVTHLSMSRRATTKDC